VRFIKHHSVPKGLEQWSYESQHITPPTKGTQVTYPALEPVVQLHRPPPTPPQLRPLAARH
jgi:hypothetical protein